MERGGGEVGRGGREVRWEGEVGRGGGEGGDEVGRGGRSREERGVGKRDRSS